MISPPVELLGVQTPRVSSVPPRVSSAGTEAVELAASAGLVLDPWQVLVLEDALGERPDGRWAAFEVGLVVARQNGKGSILEARELAGLFLFGEELIIHSAHLFDTSLEHFRRILTLIENTPDLDRRVARVSRSHGEEGIELQSGQRLRFRTRTKGGGRGFTGDVVILDEAYDLPDTAIAALMPTMSAKSQLGNPQIWYTSSAVNKDEHQNGAVLARVRRRGFKGADPSLAYFEWSVDEDIYDADPVMVAADPGMWAVANPGLGRRISVEHIAREQRSMGGKEFACERLSIGDWPVEDAASALVDYGTWRGLADDESHPKDPVAFAVDVSRDRKWAAVAVAGRREDGRAHIEVVDYRPRTDWVAARLAELVEKWRPCVLVLDPAGPAGSLIKALEEKELATVCSCHGEQGVQLFSAREVAQACGALFDAAMQDRLRHMDQPHLNTAARLVRSKPASDAWVWSRRDSPVDVSPLIAATLALHGFAEHGIELDYNPLDSIA